MKTRKTSLFTIIFISLGTLLLLTGYIKISGIENRADNADLTLSVGQLQIPVLLNREDNPVLSMCIEVKDEKQSFSVQEIKLSMAGTTRLEDIELVRIFYTKADSIFNTSQKYGEIIPDEKNIKITGDWELKPGRNYFWVSYKLKSDADLLHKVDASCEEIILGSGIKLKPNLNSSAITMRIGVALRQPWDDGVHTYRIPGLATTQKGTLLGIYDVRRTKAAGRDLQGDIDIGLCRSTDGGQTWAPMRIILDKGIWGSLPQKYNGISDACILVDDNSDNIFVAALWMHGLINRDGQFLEGLTYKNNEWNHQWRDKGSQPGFGVKQTSQFMITRSIDDGKTWEEPKNLTTLLKKKEWWLFAPAPGNGITLSDGTLVFPTQGRDAEGLPFSNITYSKDGGLTWNTSNPAFHNTTESTVVQLSDGSLMLNVRDNRNRTIKGEHNGRAVAITKDMGETWLKHPTSHKTLKEPVCMASLHKHVYVENGERKSILLFSNPNDQYRRKNMTIKVSFDDGMTWPEKYWFLLDEGQDIVWRGYYSCLTSVDNEHIGILYGGSQPWLVFEKIALNELLKIKN